MIKKIRKDQLKLGMFVHDLNCGWMEHAFWRQRFMIQEEAVLIRIQQLPVEDVYIDTVRGLDADGLTLDEVDAHLAERLREALHQDIQTTEPRAYAEEIVVARTIHQEATRVVQGLLEDVRLGKRVHVDRLHATVEQITDSILRNQGALLSLCRLKERDTYTFQHSLSVCTLLVAFAKTLGLDRDTMLLAGMGGMVHDVGKMRVPDSVLNKPGPLTTEEFQIMRSHVTLGLDILQQTPAVTGEMYEIASMHHERFSGSGYPDGLHGFEINQLGRMAAIVDVFDAMTTTRVYQEGMEPALVLRKLFEWSDQHFDPILVQRFIQSVGIYPVGSLVRLESDRLAVVLDQNPTDLFHPIVRIVFDTRTRSLIPPKDLDLSTPLLGESIQGPEDPGAWHIDPLAFLTLER